MYDNLTTREREILEILKKDPMISQDKLAEKLNITRSAVAVHISNLMRKGHIVGRGYIFDERGGVLVVGKTWLEICVKAGRAGSKDGGKGSIELACAGNGYLLALDLAQRRLEPTLITFVGRDEIGDQIIKNLHHKGVNVQNIIRSQSSATGKRMVFLDPDGAAFLVEDDEADLHLGKDAVSLKEDLIKTTKILLIDGDLPLETVTYLASQAINHSMVSSAVNCRLSLLREQGLLSHPQFFLVCPAGELAAQLGIDPAVEPEELFPVCRQVVKEGCYGLVVVFGDQGLILATGEETVYLPASPLQAPGDTLSIAAGIADGLASGYRMRMAVRRAMGSAGSVI